MSRRAITDEQRIDDYLDSAPKDQLIRLQANVAAALRWRFPVKESAKVAKPKDSAQLPMAEGAE
jgi:hypothetical protein